MKLGVRGKLFTISLALLSTVGLVSGLLLESQIRGLLAQQSESALLQHVSTIKETVELAAAHRSGVDLPALVERLALATGTRVSVIDSRGQLVADSHVDPAAARGEAAFESFPEVEDARLRGRGVHQRRSPVLQSEAIFAAVPVRLSGESGVVRAALPLRQIEQTISRVRWLLAGAGFVGLVLAILMTAVASHTLSRAFQEVVDKAQALLSKRLARQVDRYGGDELGALSFSLDRLADETERLVGDLAAERDRMAAILDGMKDGVMAVDRHGHVTLLNRGAREMLSARGGHDNAPVEEVIPVPRVVELVHEALAGVPHTEEVELTGPPGRTLTVHTAIPRGGAGVIVVIWDITALRHLERMRRDFVANVSHELKTPVSIVRANAELLLDSVLSESDPASRGLGEAILRSADRMARLVDDLLTLARIESGKYRMDKERVRVATATSEAMRTVRSHAEQRGIRMQSQVASDIEVLADRRALDHVLVNLLENAVKYGTEGGAVVVRAVPDGERVVIQVVDNGPGIAPQHRSRVFERFYRIDPGRARDAGGTGLGLSIVRHLVESQNGTVGVDAAEPRGSVFWLALPATPSEPGAAPKIGDGRPMSPLAEEFGA